MLSKKKIILSQKLKPLDIKASITLIYNKINTELMTECGIFILYVYDIYIHIHTYTHMYLFVCYYIIFFIYIILSFVLDIDFFFVFLGNLKLVSGLYKIIKCSNSQALMPNSFIFKGRLI